MIVGLLAALAMPSMITLRDDRATYNDAASIMQLFRTARVRAIARGGAVLVTMTANGNSDWGTFQLFEQDTTNAGGAGGTARTPVVTCKPPTNWVTPVSPNVNLRVDGVSLTATGTGDIEDTAQIRSALSYYQGTSAVATFTSGAVCYTPVGRSYTTYGALTGGVGDFGGKPATLDVVAIDVTRLGGGTKRTVLLPPNGMARLYSHVM